MQPGRELCGMRDFKTATTLYSPFRSTNLVFLKTALCNCRNIYRVPHQAVQFHLQHRFQRREKREKTPKPHHVFEKTSSSKTKVKRGTGMTGQTAGVYRSFSWIPCYCSAHGQNYKNYKDHPSSWRTIPLSSMAGSLCPGTKMFYLGASHLSKTVQF